MSAHNYNRNKSDSFYNSQRWRNIRSKLKLSRRKRTEHHIKQMLLAGTRIDDLSDIIESKMPHCVHCYEQYNELEPATDLDHIIAIADGGSKTSDSNLQWLCKSHHMVKSKREYMQRGKAVNNT
jgi:5-methylcytosine-specific restriction endonuclease McrA